MCKIYRYGLFSGHTLVGEYAMTPIGQKKAIDELERISKESGVDLKILPFRWINNQDSGVTLEFLTVNNDEKQLDTIDDEGALKMEIVYKYGLFLDDSLISEYPMSPEGYENADKEKLNIQNKTGNVLEVLVFRWKDVNGGKQLVTLYDEERWVALKKVEPYDLLIAEKTDFQITRNKVYVVINKISDDMVTIVNNEGQDESYHLGYFRTYQGELINK